MATAMSLRPQKRSFCSAKKENRTVMNGTAMCSQPTSSSVNAMRP